MFEASYLLAVGSNICRSLLFSMPIMQWIVPVACYTCRLE